MPRPIPIGFEVWDPIPIAREGIRPVASFTKEVNARLAKCPLVFNGRLVNHGLTSLVKKAIGVIVVCVNRIIRKHGWLAICHQARSKSTEGSEKVHIVGKPPQTVPVVGRQVADTDSAPLKLIDIDKIHLLQTSQKIVPWVSGRVYCRYLAATSYIILTVCIARLLLSIDVYNKIQRSVFFFAKIINHKSLMVNRTVVLTPSHWPLVTRHSDLELEHWLMF